MEKMKLSFQQENDILLNYILDTSILDKIKNKSFEEQKELQFYIELNITSVCNQKCDYCYLVKYGNELYPPEIRGEENILNNIRVFFDYLIENQIFPYRFDLFSGEIWGMEFGNKVFDIILEYLDKGLKCNFIMVPSNMSFLTNDKTTEVVQKYIDIFRMKDVDLRFSASFDGKYIDSDSRSYRNESKNSLKHNDAFYDKLFLFCKKNNFGFHPMVGAYKIEEWKKNIVWFYDMFEKYYMTEEYVVMFLEVRNDYWTKEKIDSYIDFLDFLIDYKIKRYFNGNVERFMDNLYSDTFNSSPKNYNILAVPYFGKSYLGCTIYRSLIVRMGDLAIGPCHRLHYNKFIYGHFIKENNKIVGIEANNVQLANRVLLGTLNSHPKCSGCNYSTVCMKGCLGSQYENNNDPLVPCKTVCDLFKTKFNFFVYKYQKLGCYDYIKKINPTVFDQLEKIRNGSEYKEWIKSM
mgnify:FL=1